MQEIRVQVTTRSGPQGTNPDPVLQAEQNGYRTTIPNRELAERIRIVLESAVEAAHVGMVTEVRVQVYPVGLVVAPAGPDLAKYRKGQG